MSNDILNHLLRELGDSVGLADLAADEDGFCLLQIGEVMVTIQHEPERDELILLSRLLVVNEKMRSETCERLLGANMLWAQTRGATFSFERAEGAVYIAIKEPMRVLDIPGFRRLLEDFVLTAEEWTERLQMPTADTAPVLDHPTFQMLAV